jgi:hypothetical protein
MNLFDIICSSILKIFFEQAAMQVASPVASHYVHRSSFNLTVTLLVQNLFRYASAIAISKIRAISHLLKNIIFTPELF